MLGAARTAWDSRAWIRPGPVYRRTTAAATLSTFTFSGVNGANYSTSKAQFGAGSLDATGSTQSIIKTNYSGPYPSGTGDFCIEGWVWLPSGRTAGTADIVCNNALGGLCVRFGSGYNLGGINNISIFARGITDLDTVAYTWPTDTWIHWAAQRKSGNISFWANGNRLYLSSGGSGGSWNFTAPSNSDFTMASYNNGGTSDETLRGWLDEVCVSDSWRYDDNAPTYYVPTAAFTVDTITNALIHFDSSLTTAAT